MTISRHLLIGVIFWGLAVAAARADVGDPQVRTDHPWYPGELACSTFERLFATQAELYERVVGVKPTTDEHKALAAWLDGIRPAPGRRRRLPRRPDRPTPGRLQRRAADGPPPPRRNAAPLPAARPVAWKDVRLLGPQLQHRRHPRSGALPHLGQPA